MASREVVPFKAVSNDADGAHFTIGRRKCNFVVGRSGPGFFVESDELTQRWLAEANDRAPQRTLIGVLKACLAAYDERSSPWVPTKSSGTHKYTHSTSSLAAAAAWEADKRWSPELIDCHRHMHKAAHKLGGAEKLFHLIDRNGDGEVDVVELIACVREVFGVAKEVVPNQTIKALFAYLDKDDSGSIGAAELAKFVIDGHGAAAGLTTAQEKALSQHSAFFENKRRQVARKLQDKRETEAVLQRTAKDIAEQRRLDAAMRAAAMVDHTPMWRRFQARARLAGGRALLRAQGFGPQAAIIRVELHEELEALKAQARRPSQAPKPIWCGCPLAKNNPYHSCVFTCFCKCGAKLFAEERTQTAHSVDADDDLKFFSL